MNPEVSFVTGPRHSTKWTQATIVFVQILTNDSLRQRWNNTRLAQGCHGCQRYSRIKWATPQVRHICICSLWNSSAQRRRAGVSAGSGLLLLMLKFAINSRCGCFSQASPRVGLGWHDGTVSTLFGSPWVCAINGRCLRIIKLVILFDIQTNLEPTLTGFCL